MKTKENTPRLGRDWHITGIFTARFLVFDRPTMNGSNTSAAKPATTGWISSAGERKKPEDQPPARSKMNAQSSPKFSWKTFFAGLVCGVVLGSAGLGFLFPGPSAPFDGPPARSSSLSERKPVAAGAFDPARVRLRSASFPCDPETSRQALEIKRAGWTYMMPKAKRSRTGWLYRETRATWWIGYWTNELTEATSIQQPQRAPNGQWIGDSKAVGYWQRGTAVPIPSKIEWLCSNSGGTPPQ